jgi:hypothetical protein
VLAERFPDQVNIRGVIFSEQYFRRFVELHNVPSIFRMPPGRLAAVCGSTNLAYPDSASFVSRIHFPGPGAKSILHDWRVLGAFLYLQTIR